MDSAQIADKAQRLFLRLVRQDRPEDPKRYALVRATQTLLSAFGALVFADVVAIVFPTTTRTLTTAAVALTLGVGSSVAILAGAAHRKPDDPIPPDPTSAPGETGGAQ